MLQERIKFVLDGYIVNHNADMAYLLSRTKKPTTKSKDILHKMALRWLRTADVQEYISERQQIIFKEVSSNPEQKNFRDKDDIVAELNVLATSVTDPKHKAEILMKIADLQQMKKEETVKSEEDTIHFYLPLKCNQCPLYTAYNEYRQQSGEKELAATEYQRIMEMTDFKVNGYLASEKKGKV